MLNNIFRLLPVIMMMAACGTKNGQSGSMDAMSTEVVYGKAKMALSENDFMIPVPQGNDWEITQSWGDHCLYCDSKYPGGTSFCKDSHNSDSAKYGWDFNLSDDLGKSVLASADGTVKTVKNGKDKDEKYLGGSWGNTIVIEHDNNICTRYAHLNDDSIVVAEQQKVCQGLKIAGIGKTGNVTGPHLHFQFENCEDHLPIKMGFNDGNGEPTCIMGKDIYTNGIYTALKLTNVEKTSCNMFCPYNSTCKNKDQAIDKFYDLNTSDLINYPPIQYLWQECVFSEKADGLFHEEYLITRAEALKIAMITFDLTKDCKAKTEPFTDVFPWSWYYPYVVCGVEKGIISTVNTKFNPEDPVNFSEAAKIAVEAAVKSGKTDIKPEAGFTFPKIGKSHWSYKYLQTIAYYNGINADLLQKKPDATVMRNEFARMIAALSPCFCQTNSCYKGYECNKANYICQPLEVSKDEDPGNGNQAGGGGTNKGDVEKICLGTQQDACSSSDVDAKSKACIPFCNSGAWECGDDGCGGDCGPCASGMYCEGGYRKCYPICKAQSCAELGCECGNCWYNGPGCSGLGTGCGECPSGKICSANKKCESDPCYNCPPGQCVNGQCLFDINKWKCDPAKGFYMNAASAGGTWEIAQSGPDSDNYGTVKVPMLKAWPSYNKPGPSVKLSCYELPTMFLIKGGPNGVKLLVEDNTFPPLEIWQPYNGSLTFNPATTPTLTTYSVDSSTPNLTMLVRLRAPICTTATCPKGKICVSGQCKMDPCLKCSAGTICVSGTCQPDPCYNCPTGYACLKGKCVTPDSCLNCPAATSCPQYKCPIGSSCFSGVCLSIPCPTTCSAGTICVSGKCQPKPCPVCSAGTICVSGTCQPDPCYNCPAGKCVNGKCKTNTCKDCPPSTLCPQYNSSCPPKSVCFSGVCLSQ